MHRPRGSSSRRASALALLAGAVVLSACAGENLFSIAAAVGGTKPTVEITVPTEGFSQAQGNPVQIRADVNAPSGLAVAEYRGVYTDDGTNAFLAETQNFQNPLFATLDNSLNPVLDQTTGGVSIIVKVTDGQGEAAADTVKITIN